VWIWAKRSLGEPSTGVDAAPQYHSAVSVKGRDLLDRDGHRCDPVVNQPRGDRLGDLERAAVAAGGRDKNSHSMSCGSFMY
jgi:hypothetical protein